MTGMAFPDAFSKGVMSHKWSRFYAYLDTIDEYGWADPKKLRRAEIKYRRSFFNQDGTLTDSWVGRQVRGELFTKETIERRMTEVGDPLAKKSLEICDTCGQNILKNEMRDMFMFQNTYHQMKAKEYCKDHVSKHSNHKCKPHWCGDCNYLMKYEIEIQKGEQVEKLKVGAEIQDVEKECLRTQ